MVTINLQKSIKRDFNDQLNILSNESSQIIASNYSILEGIVHNILSNKQDDIVSSFKQYTQKIGKYTPNVVLLANANHDIIALTSQTHNTYQDLSVANRDYIKNVLALPEETHIGHLIQGVATKIWSIPIVKGIFVNNKHLGTVILSVPLTKFSQGLLQSHIMLKNVQFGNKKHVNFHYPEADHAVTDLKTHDVISSHDILLSAFLGKKDMTISKTYEPLPNISENITLVMPAVYIQKLFWSQVAINFGIFCICTVCIILLILLIIQTLSHKLSSIEEKLLNSVSKLRYLVPGYNNSAYFVEHTGRYSKMLSNVEHYVDSNMLVIDTLEKQHTIILEKDRQLAGLQMHFANCLSALREEVLYFMEEIEDMCSNNADTSCILYKDHRQLLTAFEKIYSYSKNHEEYILSLQDSIADSHKIILGTKSEISIEDILKSKFAHKYDSLTINKHVNSQCEPPSNTSLVNNSTMSVVKKIFFREAVETAIESILTMSSKNNCGISLCEQNNSISIEIRFDLDKYSISNSQIQEALEKARLFALLDEGFIGLYHSEDALIITIVYAINISSISLEKGFYNSELIERI